MISQDDPHADRYPAVPSFVNDTATAPPALDRMLAERVEVSITFADRSAYVATFGPCWADMGVPRDGDLDRLDPIIAVADDVRALPDLTRRAFGLMLAQRVQQTGALFPAPMGQIRTVPAPAEAAELAAAGAPPPRDVAMLIASLRAAVDAGLGWQVTRDAAASLLALIDSGAP